MSQSSQGEASWGKFFGGCLVMLLIVGGAVGFFVNANKKAEARKQQLRETLLEAYWDSLGTDKFAEIFAKSSTPLRQEKVSADELNEKFISYSEEHKGLTGVRIHALNEESVLGSEDRWLKVTALMDFQDGTILKLSYKLKETDSSSYLIDIVTSGNKRLDAPYW